MNGGDGFRASGCEQNGNAICGGDPDGNSGAHADQSIGFSRRRRCSCRDLEILAAVDLSGSNGKGLGYGGGLRGRKAVENPASLPVRKLPVPDHHSYPYHVS